MGNPLKISEENQKKIQSHLVFQGGFFKPFQWRCPLSDFKRTLRSDAGAQPFDVCAGALAKSDGNKWKSDRLAANLCFGFDLFLKL